MKINNYIKYLLSLILLPGINIYAQASENLSQIISQAQQEASGLSPFFNLSSTTNTPIIKDLINTLGSSFLGFAIPFLFVFGVFTFITYLTKKEINRPLLLIYFIIDLLVTIFYPAILVLLAIILAILLLLFGFYKLFHTLTGSTIGGITGAIITPLILYVLLTNGTNIIGFLFSSAFYVLLFIFLIFIFIYGYKLSQSSDTKKLKKLIYHISKPEDIKKFKNDIDQKVKDFENHSGNMVSRFESSINSLRQYLGSRRQKKAEKIIDLLRDIENNVKGFRGYYRGKKMEIKNDETFIEKHYNEPIKSELLKILREGEKKIDDEARKAFKEYSDKYYHELQPMKSLIVSIIMRVKNRGRKRRVIENIYADIEDTINNFWT